VILKDCVLICFLVAASIN